MSDTINEDDSDCNSLKQKEGDECTMRDVLESNSYARRLDIQNKKRNDQ